MISLINKNKIQLTVGVVTGIFIITYPFFRPETQEDAAAFRSLFGQIAAISFLLYVGLFAIFSIILKKFQLTRNFIYLAHITAFIIGYSLLLWAFYSVANLAFPMWG
jgi:hypothetical protein